jgi:hypothetical protein
MWQAIRDWWNLKRVRVRLSLLPPEARQAVLRAAGVDADGVLLQRPVQALGLPPGRLSEKGDEGSRNPLVP